VKYDQAASIRLQSDVATGLHFKSTSRPDAQLLPARAATNVLRLVIDAAWSLHRKNRSWFYDKVEPPHLGGHPCPPTNP
jgi:hypothetical protein